MITISVVGDTPREELEEFNALFSGAVPASIYDDVDELQQKVAALETELNDTGWKTLTLLNGATAYNAAQTPQYRKVGKQVFVRGVFKGITAPCTIAQLPVDFRPSQRIIFCYPRTGYVVTKFEIETTGEIKYVGTGDTMSASTWFSFSNTSFFTD